MLSYLKANSGPLRVLNRFDPTYTLTLRKTFEGKLSKRFRWLKGQINKSIVKNDCFGLKINQPIPIQQFAFDRDPDKVNSFMQWLQTQINLGIVEVSIGAQIGEAVEQAWTNKYITTAYKKGIIRARQEMHTRGYSVPRLQGSTGLEPTFNRPFHLDRVGLIYTRTYEGLKGITNEMSKQISGILAQGIVEGKGPSELARNLNERVDKIGIVRAKKLARTEIIRAHHHATIKEYENWGIAGVTVLAEFVTAGDGRVCERCLSLARRDNGYGIGIYTLSQALGLIPVHPECRCIVLPLDITDNEELLEKLKVAA